MMVFLSFFNFILMKSASAERSIMWLCHAANIVGLIFALTMFAINFLKGIPPIPVWLVLFLFVFETFTAFRHRSQ